MDAIGRKEYDIPVITFVWLFSGYSVLLAVVTTSYFFYKYHSQNIFNLKLKNKITLYTTFSSVLSAGVTTYYSNPSDTLEAVIGLVFRAIIRFVIFYIVIDFCSSKRAIYVFAQTYLFAFVVHLSWSFIKYPAAFAFRSHSLLLREPNIISLSIPLTIVAFTIIFDENNSHILRKSIFLSTVSILGVFSGSRVAVFSSCIFLLLTLLNSIEFKRHISPSRLTVIFSMIAGLIIITIGIAGEANEGLYYFAERLGDTYNNLVDSTYGNDGDWTSGRIARLIAFGSAKLVGPSDLALISITHNAFLDIALSSGLLLMVTFMFINTLYFVGAILRSKSSLKIPTVKLGIIVIFGCWIIDSFLSGASGGLYSQVLFFCTPLFIYRSSLPRSTLTEDNLVL